jgi:hypothetical protein
MGLPATARIGFADATPEAVEPIDNTIISFLACVLAEPPIWRRIEVPPEVLRSPPVATREPRIVHAVANFSGDNVGYRAWVLLVCHWQTLKPQYRVRREWSDARGRSNIDLPVRG